MGGRITKTALLCLSFTLACRVGVVRATNGYMLRGIGAKSASFAGADVAAPLNIVGSLWANPAGISELTRENRFQADFSFETIVIGLEERSSVPGVGAGRTFGNDQVYPLPAFGLAYRPRGSRASYYLGAYAIGGFGTDFPQDDTNPIFANPLKGGFGNVFSLYTLMRAPMGMVYDFDAIPGKFSAHFGPNVNVANFNANPGAFAAPDFDTINGRFVFPDASTTSIRLGFGFQTGFYWRLPFWDEKISVGANYFSEGWMVKGFDFRVKRLAPSGFGSGRELTFTINVPQIVTWGVGIRPVPGTLIGLSGKWINYADTQGFANDRCGFAPGGFVRGLCWDDVFAAGIGLQVQPSKLFELPPPSNGLGRMLDGMTVRLGFNHSNASVPSDQAFFNVFAPGNVKDQFTFGLGMPLGAGFHMDLGGYIGFNNTVSGPFPAGVAPPGSQVSGDIKEFSGLMTISWTGVREEAPVHRGAEATPGKSPRRSMANGSSPNLNGWTAARKTAVVMELLRGGDATELARRHNLREAQLLAWRDQFLEGGGAALGNASQR